MHTPTHTHTHTHTHMQVAQQWADNLKSTKQCAMEHSNQTWQRSRYAAVLSTHPGATNGVGENLATAWGTAPITKNGKDVSLMWAAEKLDYNLGAICVFLRSMCIHVYIYMHTYIRTRIHIYVYIYTYMHICLFLRLMCMHTYTHACIRTCTHTCIHIYVYIYTYMHTYICRRVQ